MVRCMSRNQQAQCTLSSHCKLEKSLYYFVPQFLYLQSESHLTTLPFLEIRSGLKFILNVGMSRAKPIKHLTYQNEDRLSFITLVMVNL